MRHTWDTARPYLGKDQMPSRHKHPTRTRRVLAELGIINRVGEQGLRMPEGQNNLEEEGWAGKQGTDKMAQDSPASQGRLELGEKGAGIWCLMSWKRQRPEMIQAGRQARIGKRTHHVFTKLYIILIQLVF